MNGIAAVGTFMRVFVGGMLEMTGAVLAGRTVTKNEVLLDFPPVSMTQTVIVEEPGWFPAVTFTVRLELLPPKVMFAFGITL